MLSVFYGLQMTSAEDCAAFSSKLEQKLSYVQAMYPEELNTKQYWHLLRERFFHGLPVNLRTNIRSEYEKGTDYYLLLQAARMIENELRADPQFKSVDKTEHKTDKKSKVKGAATNLLGADKELTHLEQAWSETANEMKAMQKTLQDITACIGHLQQNRTPQPVPSTNPGVPTNQGNNNFQRGRGFYRGRGGRNRGRGQNFYQDRPPICWWCKGNVSREEAQHRIQDCPIYNECRENWWKTHPTNSDTTIPSNPEQEENWEGNPLKRCKRVPLVLMIHLKRVLFMCHKQNQKQVLERKKVKVLVKQISKLKLKVNQLVIPTLMLGEG